MNTLQMLTVIEGVKATAVDENGNRVAAGLLLKNKDLLSRFKAPTPKELCRKLFLSGEVANMYNAKKTFAEVPAVLKDKVKEILIDLEVPELAE